MRPLPYANILFDLYGTLVDIRTDEDDPAAWAALACFYAYSGAAYSPVALRSAYLALVERQTAGKFEAKGAEAGDALAVHAGQFFRAMTTRYLRLYDGVPAMLAQLRGRGARLFLVSNAQAIFTRCELRALGLDGAFDAVYLSSDYGCKKPDARFFRLALEGQRLDPARCIMVGNDPVCDIAGAQAVGLATLYVRSNLSPAGPPPRATYLLPEMDIPRMVALLCGEA